MASEHTHTRPLPRPAWTGTATPGTQTPAASAYPTSLRTSLYANSPRTATAPLSAHRHAPVSLERTGGPGATPRRQVKVAASPRVSLTEAHAQPRSAVVGTTTTYGGSKDPPRRRPGPRTSNPFDDLSAPAFDSFIDNLTSTLRSVLEPPPPPHARSSQSSRSEERQHRERERQERARQREQAQRARDARNARAAANGLAPDQAQQGADDRDRPRDQDDVDVFGEVKEVAAVAAHTAGDDAQNRINGRAADHADGGNERPRDPNRLASVVAAATADSYARQSAAAVVTVAAAAADDGDGSEPRPWPADPTRPSSVESDVIVLGSSSEEGEDELVDEDEDDVDAARGGDAGDVNSADDDDDDDDADQEHVATSALLEMRQVDHRADELVRPLFLQRGTASVSTSEADADELFRPCDVDADNDHSAAAAEEDELVGGDASYPALHEHGDVILSPGGGEDVYDVDALGEGIEEEEKLEAQLETSRGERSMFPSGSHEEDGPFIDTAMMPEEAEQDPSVYKDPFGRPIRYAHGFAEAGESDYEEYDEYDEAARHRQELERGPSLDDEGEEDEEDDDEDEDEDGGNAMDSAEAEWAGRRSLKARDVPDPVASDEPEQEGDQVEVLELDTESDADAGPGADGGEDVEPTNLTAEVLGGARPATLAGDGSFEGRSPPPGEDRADAEIEPAEPMGLANAPTPTAAPSCEAAASTETSGELEVTPLPVPGEEGGAEVADAMDLPSTATTPALQTPAAVPDDDGDDDDEVGGFFGARSFEEDKAVDSGALADVDEDVVMREPEPDSTGRVQTDGADLLEIAALEEEVVATVEPATAQVALPLSGTAEIEPLEVEDSDLADVEEEEAAIGERAEESEGAFIRAEPGSDADSLIVPEVSGLARFDDGGDEDIDAEEPAEPTRAAMNPLEALYEHEDSEDLVARIPYEAKGKGRAPMTPSELEYEGEVGAEGFVGSESSSSSAESEEGNVEDRIEFAISQWHSFSDQLRFYDRHELVEKVVELREQYAHANKINSPWEVFVRIQLHDVETEFERRRVAGVDAADSEEEEEEEGHDDDAMVDPERDEEVEEEIQSQQGEEGTDEEGSDIDRHALFLDEEYEMDADGEVSADAEHMREADTGSPAPVDRSAFPDSSSPARESDTFPAERRATEAEISAIVDELVSMHDMNSTSALYVLPSAHITAAASSASGEPYSHAASAEGLERGGPDLPYAPESTSPRQASAADASPATTPSVGPASSVGRLDPHRPFLRHSEASSVVRHAGNIEYELAPPGRSLSPPRFERVPAGHRVDSPVTVDGDEQDAEGEAVDDEVIRVGVDEEEMADSSFVGRVQPLSGFVDASREDVHEQADLEDMPTDSQALVVIDDDDDGDDAEGHRLDKPVEKTTGPPVPQALPRKRIGATPPPSFEGEGPVAPIIAGVAPPVNFDIVPDPPHQPERDSETTFPAHTGRLEHKEESLAPPAPDSAGQTRSLKGGEDEPKLPSALLNRESAAQEATIDTRVAFQVPPTIHRPDSPLEEDELSEEDDEVVRVGVAAEEELDARWVEEAKPLARGIDVSDRPRHEQVDVAVAAEDAGSAALTIVDDDVDAASPTIDPVEATPGLASVQASLSTVSPSTAPAELLFRREEATAFPYGVAPPQNPDIVPASTAALPAATDDTFDVADFVALGSDDDEDVFDAQSTAPLPITRSSQAEHHPVTESNTADATGHQVLGLPAEDAASATYESPVAALDSDEEEDRVSELVVGGDKLENAPEAETVESAIMSEVADRASPLHVSGVQEPGEWDPTSPIRFGVVRHAEPDASDTAKAKPDGMDEGQAPGLVQVTLQVETDGEGASVRESRMETEGTPDHCDYRSSRAHVDDVRVHYREPESESAASGDKKDEGLQAQAHFAESALDGAATASSDPSLRAADVESVDVVDFAEDPAQETTGSPANDEALLRQYTPLPDEIEYTESDSDDDDEVLALLSPRKPTAAGGSSHAGKSAKRTTARLDAIAQDESTESPLVVRRSSRLSTTPAATLVPPPSKQAAPSKRPRAEQHTPSVSASASSAKRPRQAKVIRSASSRTAQDLAPLGVRQHRHRHHLPEVHGSDTDDGITPPVTRSHCHFERFKIASRADPEAAPYLFNVPACALSSEVARDTIKAFDAEDLGPVDETDGCEGIQLGGVSPTDADAIKVMASRHSNLIPHEDVLDAVRRIAGPELWDEGACEVVPQEEVESAAERSRTKRKGKRRASVEATEPQQQSAKKRR